MEELSCYLTCFLVRGGSPKCFQCSEAASESTGEMKPVFEVDRVEL